MQVTCVMAHITYYTTQTDGECGDSDRVLTM